MKAIVEKKFHDIKTDKIRNVGEIFTCSKQRYEEIRSVDPGLVAEYKEQSGEPVEKQAE